MTTTATTVVRDGRMMTHIVLLGDSRLPMATVSRKMSALAQATAHANGHGSGRRVGAVKRREGEHRGVYGTYVEWEAEYRLA